VFRKKGAAVSETNVRCVHYVHFCIEHVVSEMTSDVKVAAHMRNMSVCSTARVLPALRLDDQLCNWTNGVRTLQWYLLVVTD